MVRRHYVHMMDSASMDALLARFPVKVLKRRSAGLFAQRPPDALGRAYEDPELRAFPLEQEVVHNRRLGTLDCGLNMIYVVEKQ